MDAIVARCQESTDPVALLQFLKGQQHQLESAAGQAINAIAALDPAQHSLGYLFLLETRASSNPPAADIPRLIDVTATFLQLCSTLVQLAPEQLVSLCQSFKTMCMLQGQPTRAVLPLRTALRKLQPSCSCLTPIHADFFQVCLLSKVYNAAVEVLDDNILEVEPAKTAMTPPDLLLYSLYGGMLATGRHQYSRALSLFLMGLTAPTTVISAITQAIYKKYLLVSLIHTGEVAPLPKLTASVVLRGIKSEAEPYSQLAAAWAANKSAEEVAQLVTLHSPTFQQDGNMGLVAQVQAAQRKRGVQSLTRTYLTLSLQHIAEAVGAASPAGAEQYILQLVDDGHVSASVSERNGMVRFMEEGPSARTAGGEALGTKLELLVASSMELAQKLAVAHQQVSTDKAYLGKVHMSERHRRYEEQPDYGGDEGGFPFRVVGP